jgi:hypothetical protein
MAFVEINERLVLAFAHRDGEMSLLHQLHGSVLIDMGELEVSHAGMNSPNTNQHAIVRRMQYVIQKIQDAIEMPIWHGWRRPDCKSGSIYSTIGSGTASQATPQGRRHKRAEVGFELAIKRLPARRHDH